MKYSMYMVVITHKVHVYWQSVEVMKRTATKEDESLEW